VEKNVAQKCRLCNSLILIKLPKVNNHPLGENSHNLVTLISADDYINIISALLVERGFCIFSQQARPRRPLATAARQKTIFFHILKYLLYIYIIQMDLSDLCA
jgi:hypothetical protein